MTCTNAYLFSSLIHCSYVFDLNMSILSAKSLRSSYIEDQSCCDRLNWLCIEVKSLGLISSLLSFLEDLSVHQLILINPTVWYQCPSIEMALLTSRLPFTSWSFDRVNFRIPNYYHWFLACMRMLILNSQNIYTCKKFSFLYDALSAGLAWSETEVFHIGRSYFDQYPKTVINHSFSCGFSLTVISEDNQTLLPQPNNHQWFFEKESTYSKNR